MNKFGYLPALLGCMGIGVSALHAETIFTEDFENPDVSASSTTQFGATFHLSSVPSGGNWIGATTGFGANRRGLIHQSFGDFTVTSGAQAYYFGYTNSGITTSTAAIQEPLSLGKSYTVSFDLARDNDVTQSSCIVQLVAFAEGDDNTKRVDVRPGVSPGTVLASVNRTVTSNDLSERFSFSFEADDELHAAHLGKGLGMRVLGNSSRPIINNIELTAVTLGSGDGGSGDGGSGDGGSGDGGSGDGGGGDGGGGDGGSGDGGGGEDWSNLGITLLLTESFESPDVSTTSSVQHGATYNLGSVPDGGNWIGSTNGFGSNRRGLIHQSFGDFTAPTGNQGYYFAYTNTGLTSSAAAITELLEADVVYTLSFDVARDNDVAQSNYRMELVAFDPANGDTGRNNATASRPGTVLAFRSGTVTSNDLSERISFDFQADPELHAAHIGKALAVRFIGNSSCPILDNIELIRFDPDTDGDGMPDAWEIHHFGNLSHDGTADTDGDGLTDLFEFQAGLDPTNPDTNGDGFADWIGVPGYLSAEEWHDLPGSTLADLFGNQAFYGEPDESYYVPEVRSDTDIADEYGIRLRGTIRAPQTGAYRFWISGEGESVVYLSTDHTPFNRRRIAWVPTASSVEGWDDSPEQKSGLIQLVADQEYFIEVIMKAGEGDDHLAVAWEYSSEARHIIPGSVLKSFVPHPDDLDDDGMRDSWEIQVGLDPNDNGFNNLNQSGYLDPDQDGLLTFEEYQYNGNPFQAGGNVGFLEFDRWIDLPGSHINELVLTNAYALGPNTRSYVGSSTSGWGANYGARMRGTVTPAESGDYHFYVAGDDVAELWISPTASRFDKRRVAWTGTRTNHQQWNAFPSQKTGIISMVAGQSYYIEALVKNGTNADHLSIGWSKIVPTNASWSTQDVGLAESATWSAEADGVVVNSQGGDVWNNQDSFTFRYVEMTGDCVLTIRVNDINAAHEWAKVGVMIRGSLDAGSQNAMALRTGSRRLVSQSRSTPNNITLSSYRSDPLNPDQWLRIARVGNQIYSYSSDNGVTWNQFAQSGVNLPPTAYIGIAVSGIGENAVEAMIDHITLAASTSIEPLPSSVLRSVIPDPNDLDDDNLPDDWEIAMGLDPTTALNGMGQYGDPDQDGVDNLTEYQFGGNPMVFEGVPGNLTREVWNSHPAGTIHQWVRSPEFLAGPDHTTLLSETEFRRIDEPQGFAQRVRGRLVAPVTGNYRFWISGSRDFELWLSSDSSKFNKRKIASALQWSENDVQSVAFRGWDAHGSQSSQWLHLEQGQEYFIEILHKDVWRNGHFSVAWSYVDTVTGDRFGRSLIDPTHLRTYVDDPDDADDDYLPDSWEVQYGLDPEDNGSGNPLLQGQYGDFDGDGLTNHEEWLLGTNPANADTDGDGVDDYREIHVYGSDPTVADILPPVLVSQLNLATFGATSGDWYANADGSISSTVRRGYVTYTIHVTEPGVHLLEIAGRAQGSTRDIDDMPLVVSINGATVGSYTLRSLNGGQGLVELLTPWLSAGTHTVRILSDNHRANRRLQIDSVRLLLPAGVDADEDGIPDWVGNQLSQANGVTICPEESLVSPLCVEGMARFFNQIAITADQDPVTAIQGINGGWFADVDLNAPEANGPDMPTVLDFTFEDGLISEQHTVTWISTNVLEYDELRIRRGESLRLTGIPDEIDPTDFENLRVSLSVNEVEVASDLHVTAPHIHLFDTAGEHVVDVVVSHGHLTFAGTMIVHVVDADFGGPFQVLAGTSRTWATPGIAGDIHVEADSELSFYELALADDGIRRFRVDSNGRAESRVIARTEEDGPVVDAEDVAGYRAYRTDATGDIRIIQTYPNGDQVVQMSVVLPDGLPPGGYVRMKIFVAGVTFLDGTIVKFLTAEDFDVNGIAYVNFNFPAGTLTSVCHNLTLHDADGVEIGQH